MIATVPDFNPKVNTTRMKVTFTTCSFLASYFLRGSKKPENCQIQKGKNIFDHGKTTCSDWEPQAGERPECHRKQYDQKLG